MENDPDGCEQVLPNHVWWLKAEYLKRRHHSVETYVAQSMVAWGSSSHASATYSLFSENCVVVVSYRPNGISMDEN